jgi:hypothetical protein
MTGKNATNAAIILLLAAFTGFLLPQHFGGVKKLQAVFFLANEQLINPDDCSHAATGPWTTVKSNTLDVPCNLVLRARDIYEGVSFSEALETFENDLFWDQIRFAAFFASFSLAAMLGLAGVQRLLFTRNRDNQTLLPAELPAPGRS